MMISKAMKKQLEGNSTIRLMFQEGKDMAKKVGAENVFDFSIGNPNVPAPKEVNESIKAIVDEVDSVYLHGYMANEGYPETRKVIAEHLNRRFGTSYGVGNILMIAGAAAGLNIALKALLDEGDEVITFRPYFLEYGNYVRNYGGVLRTVPTDKETFLPDMEELRSAISEKTKAVIINTPNNPTGAIYGEETLRELSSLLSEESRKYGTHIVLISDEPYRELCYDGLTQPWVAAFYPDTIVCYSFSKSLSLPGERIGYCVVPDELCCHEDIYSCMSIANRTLGMVNAPSLMQKVIERCIDTDISENVKAYDRNRKLLYGILKEAGFEAAYPQGAFYIWIKTPEGLTDQEFCNICKRHYVLIVPGSSFEGSGHMRAAYCVSEDTIRRSEQAWKDIASECGLR